MEKIGKNFGAVFCGFFAQAFAGRGWQGAEFCVVSFGLVDFVLGVFVCLAAMAIGRGS